MVKIVPRDLECPTCLMPLAPNDPENPTVMIETCAEFTHQECLERHVLNKFQESVLGFFSNTRESFKEFQSMQGRYLTSRHYYTLDEVVYNHNIDEIWEQFDPQEVGQDDYELQREEIEIQGCNSCHQAFVPESIRITVRDVRARNLTGARIRRNLGAARRQVFRTEEWGIGQWMWFSARLVYHATVAFFIELNLQLGLWLYENAFDGTGGREYVKDFREANVSHRLTPLFREYEGIRYNPELKKTVEERAWEWIGDQVSSARRWAFG